MVGPGPGPEATGRNPAEDKERRRFGMAEEGRASRH